MTSLIDPALDAEKLVENLATVRGQVAAAAEAAGRDPAVVTLVAVGKTHPSDWIEAALKAGQRFSP